MDEYFSINTYEHYGCMFSSLHTLQREGVVCDVILAAEDGEVMAHKVMLMAASSYFRERLSPTISGTASKIFLKGISVVELANLVKYIYTGKLFVAKESVEVTLEIAGILGLDAVIKGYNDIMHLAYLRCHKKQTSTTGNSNQQQPSGQNVNLVDTPVSNLVTEAEKKSTSIGSNVSMCGDVQHVSEEIKVLQYNPDGSATTYTSTVSQSGSTTDVSTTGAPPAAGGDCDGVELQQVCQQYVEVPAGSPHRHSHTASTYTAGVPALETVVIDEQAQHQDLLSVAIKKLSDRSSPDVEDSGIAGQNQDGAVVENTQNKKNEQYVNGKIDTKIVTLSAGKISNELGGHTSVYTVALDPSTIKQPLKMPRFMRRKTDKEKQAEQTAKRYRQKKAELIAAKLHPDRGDVEHEEQDPADIFSHQPNIVVEVKNVNDQLVVQATEDVLMFHDSLGQSQTSLQLENMADMSTSGGLSSQASSGLFTQQQMGSMSQVVLEDGIVHHGTVSEGIDKAQEDFSCSVNFDSEDNNDDIQVDSSTVNMSGEKEISNVHVDKQPMEYSLPVVIEHNSVHQTIISQPSDNSTLTIQPLSEDKLENVRKSSVTESNVVTITAHDDLHDMNTLQTMTEESPDTSHEKQDSDHEKSSASKRKTKVPRRLSLSGDKETGRNIPIVQTRRSSRNEASPKKQTFSNSVDSKQSKSSPEVKDQNVDQQLKPPGYVKSVKVVYSRGKSQEDGNDANKNSSMDETSDSDVDVVTDSDLYLEMDCDEIDKPRTRNSVKRKTKNEAPKARKVLKTEAKSQDSLGYSDQQIGERIPGSGKVLTRSLRKHSQKDAGANEEGLGSSRLTENQNVHTQSDDSCTNVPKSPKEAPDTSDPGFEKTHTETVEIKEELDTDDSQDLCDKIQGGGDNKVTLKNELTNEAPKAGQQAQREQHQCEYCSFLTNSKGALMTHIKVKHLDHENQHLWFNVAIKEEVVDVEDEYTTNISLLPCQFCEYKTPLAGNLRKHMQVAHQLTVVIKRHNANKIKFKDFEEGALVTSDGKLFDPKTMPLPKLSNRTHDKSENIKDSTNTRASRVRKSKSNLMNLSNEDFTKEILKRHEEYLKQPEKVHKVMSKSLAVATAHPSFPQASPSIRVNKANKLYNTQKMNRDYTAYANTVSQDRHIIPVQTSDTSLPEVEQEIIIQGQNQNLELVNVNQNTEDILVTVQDQVEPKSDEVVVTLQDNGDGNLIPIQFIVNNDGQKSVTDGVNVVNVLLEGQQIAVHEEVEIQNE